MTLDLFFFLSFLPACSRTKFRPISLLERLRRLAGWLAGWLQGDVVETSMCAHLFFYNDLLPQRTKRSNARSKVLLVASLVRWLLCDISSLSRATN